MLSRALTVALGMLVVPPAFVSACEESPELASLPARSVTPPAPSAAPARTSEKPAASASVDAGPSICGPGMVLVSGNYCTEVDQVCSRWLDDEKLPFARCAEYSSARCIGQRKPMRFCIDQHEYTPPGETLPQNYASYQIASKTCRSLGKRLCGEVEWTFACEGEEMRPYAYGFSRQPVCNYDKSDLYEMQKGKQVLKDLRAPSGSHDACVSPFGVYDMAGNMDEPTRREHAFEAKFNNALKGGWWMAARNRCRPATTAHDDYYKDIQVGIRCCMDAPAASGPTG